MLSSMYSPDSCCSLVVTITPLASFVADWRKAIPFALSGPFTASMIVVRSAYFDLKCGLVGDFAAGCMAVCALRKAGAIFVIVSLVFIVPSGQSEPCLWIVVRIH